MLLTITKIFLQGTECSELQEQLKDREKVLIEKDTVLKEKTLKLKQVMHQVKDSEKDNGSMVQLQEELISVEAKLEAAERALGEKTKQSAEKDRKIKNVYLICCMFSLLLLSKTSLQSYYIYILWAVHGIYVCLQCMCMGSHLILHFIEVSYCLLYTNVCS
jgi:hypothetical protein